MTETLPRPNANNPEDIEAELKRQEQEQHLRPEAEVTAEEIADLPDSEARYSDIELLGKRFPVRRAVFETANQYVTAAHYLEAKRKNALDTPAKLRLGFSHSVANSRYNRHARKLMDAMSIPEDTPEDELTNLANGHASNRVVRRRQQKFLRAKAKKDSAYNKLIAHSARMEGRTQAVFENSEARSDAYRAKLRGKRETALANRAVRRELRAQGAGYFESKNILKEIPREHLLRVGNIAANAETTRRYTRSAERTKANAAEKQQRLIEKITAISQKARQHEEEALRATETVMELRGESGNPEDPPEGSLPYAQNHLASLEQSLEEMANDDPMRESLALQVDEARQKVDIIEQREIPYWQNVAIRNQERAAELTQLEERLRAQELEQFKIVEREAQAADAQQIQLEEDTEAVRVAAQEATSVTEPEPTPVASIESPDPHETTRPQPQPSPTPPTPTPPTSSSESSAERKHSAIEALEALERELQENNRRVAEATKHQQLAAQGLHESMDIDREIPTKNPDGTAMELGQLQNMLANAQSELEGLSESNPQLASRRAELQKEVDSLQRSVDLTYHSSELVDDYADAYEEYQQALAARNATEAKLYRLEKDLWKNNKSAYVQHAYARSN